MNSVVDTQEQKFIYSRLAPDPDLRDIVDLFVEEMPNRIAALLDQLQSADLEGLRRTAHQLKGAAGSYGFDAISPAAARVESAIRDNEDEERLQETVRDLVALCQCARSGVPEK
jgi:histidine phosphotransfer protein HptB